jgi:hypothetical protein
MDMERLNLKKLNEGEVKEEYQVTITKKFAALENVQNNWSIINHGLVSNVQNWLMKGSRLNYRDCRTQVKCMKMT